MVYRKISNEKSFRSFIFYISSKRFQYLKISEKHDQANDKSNISRDTFKDLKDGDSVQFTLLPMGPLKFHSPLEEKYRKKAEDVKQKEKLHANIKLLILACMQKMIEEYEYSAQYFSDIGVKPPLGVENRSDFEKAKANLKKVFENK